MTATELPHEVSTLQRLLGEKAELVRALQAEITQLKLLTEFGQQIGLAASEAELYRLAAHYTTRLFTASLRTSIALLDASGDNLQIFALEGQTSTIPVGKVMPVNGSILGLAVRERRVVLMTGAEFAQSELLGVKTLRGSGMNTALISPLVSGGEVIGTLNTGSALDAAYGEQDTDLLLHVATLLASHVERWRLVVKLQGSLQKTQQHEQQLQNDLIERARAEQERATLQAQITLAQQRRLKEMSTPLIPITNSVMVMPLIGSMDEGRAQQMLDAVLHGAQQWRAAIIIIDITGMQQLDRYAASSLLNAAKALRLLGCKTMLSGVRAEVAQTLVGLGIGLDAIVTRGSLQSAIAHALAHTA